MDFICSVWVTTFPNAFPEYLINSRWLLWLIYIYVTGGIQFYFFGYNAPKDALSWVLQMRGHDVTSRRYIVYPLWRHILTSFVTSHGTCAEAIKQLGAASGGTHWSNSCWEVHLHAWIDALALPRWESLLPSNIADWVVLVRPRASGFIDAPITLREQPGNAVFFLWSTASTGPLCLSVGARVHYLLSCCLHLRKHSAEAATYIISARCMSQILASLGGRRLKQHVARSVDGVPPRLWPESSSVVAGK